MSIRSNIEEMMGKVKDDPSVGDELQIKAVDAIKSGQGSAEWEAYMSLFSSNATELARLLPTDSTAGEFAMDIARTRLIGNGTCGAETTGSSLLDGVNDTLDQGL